MSISANAILCDWGDNPNYTARNWQEIASGLHLVDLAVGTSGKQKVWRPALLHWGKVYHEQSERWLRGAYVHSTPGLQYHVVTLVKFALNPASGHFTRIVHGKIKTVGKLEEAVGIMLAAGKEVFK